MWEFVKDFFTTKEACARSVRALSLGVAALALTPEVQVLLASSLGPWAALVPVVAALLAGGVAAGEKNPQ